MTTSDTGIPQTVNFNNVEFSNKKDLELKFAILAKIKSISVIVKGQIKLMAEQKKVRI